VAGANVIDRFSKDDYNIFNLKNNVMREKRFAYLFREPAVGASRYGCEEFRSGTANDEFDG
jgi:hypothetical protein